MSTEYTPSREDVEAFMTTLRMTYQAHMANLQDDDEDRLAEYGKNFEMFMAARNDLIEAAAEQRGAVTELEALGDKLTDGKDPETDTRIFDPWDVAQLLYIRADVIKNPPRADQYRKEDDE